MHIGSFLTFLVLVLIGMAFVLGVQMEGSCDAQCAFAIEQQRRVAEEQHALFSDEREARAERNKAWSDAIRVAVPPLAWMIGGSIFVLSSGFAWQCYADGCATFRRREYRRIRS